MTKAERDFLHAMCSILDAGSRGQWPPQTFRGDFVLEWYKTARAMLENRGAERDFFEAARAECERCNVPSRQDPEIVAYRALIAEEEKRNVGTGASTDAIVETVVASQNQVASAPVAEPKRGVEEHLAHVRGSLLWNYREGHMEFAAKAIAAIDEALHLYREERDGRK